MNGLPPETDIFPRTLLSFIHVIPGGYVDVHGDVTSRNVTIQSQGCMMTSVGGKYSQEWNIVDKVFVISSRWGEAFYHSMMENLPRLLPWLKYLQDNPDIQIHIKSMYHNILQKVFGISYSRMTTGNIRGKIILLPAGTPCGRPTLFTIQLFWYQLHKRLSIMETAEKRNIILIKRINHRKRYFANHDAIYEMLQQRAAEHNMSVKVFDDGKLPSLQDTAMMFNQAYMVIGPHGAGMVNMLFSQPGTVLIEGLCRSALNLCYGSMSQVLGFRYYGYYRPDVDCFDYTAEELQVPVRTYLEERKKLVDSM